MEMDHADAEQLLATLLQFRTRPAHGAGRFVHADAHVVSALQPAEQAVFVSVAVLAMACLTNGEQQGVQGVSRSKTGDAIPASAVARERFASIYMQRLLEYHRLIENGC